MGHGQHCFLWVMLDRSRGFPLQKLWKSTFLGYLLMALLCLQDLLGLRGLMNANQLEQQAAISSLATLMSIAPGDTYLEFEKVLT